jgi:dienelactone hydrolase
MLYHPQDGRKFHPLVLITHGRNGPNPQPNPRQAEGYRQLNTVLAEHGYEVMMLVRRGYGNSQGPDSEFLYTAEESGLAGAKDVKAAIDYMCHQAAIDCNHIVIMGQSQGGWVALAASTIPIKGVLGAVNISGAVNFKQGAGLGIRSKTVEDLLKASASAFGHNAKVPTLWIYAENDNHLPDTVKAWFAAYIESGGKGRLAVKPAYKDRGHAIVTEPALYIDDIFSFFKEIGLREYENEVIGKRDNQ